MPKATKRANPPQPLPAALALQAMAQISRLAAAEGPLEALLAQVVELVRQNFGLARVAAYLLAQSETSTPALAAEPASGLLRCVAASGGSEEDPARSLVARAAVSQAAVLDNEGSELAVPLLVSDLPLPAGEGGAGQVVGVLDLRPAGPGRFSEADVQLYTLLAEHLALAAQHARALAALAAARQSQQLLRSIIDATPDWIFIKDQAYRYILVNQGYANALHLPPEQFIGKNDLELGFPEELVKGDPARGIRGFWTDDRQVMDSGQPLVNPYDPATIDGQVHAFHTIKTPLRDPAGRITGVLAFARDITEREQLLAQTQALYEVSARLNAAITLEDVVHALATPGLAAGAGTIALSTFETGVPGPEIEWSRLTALWEQGAPSGLPVGARFHLSELPLAKLWLADPAPLLIGSIYRDERVDPASRVIFQRIGAGAAVLLPLRVSGRWAGLLMLTWPLPRQFTVNDQRLYKVIADQAAVVVNNSLLLEQTRQRAAELEQLVQQREQQARREQILRQVTARVHASADVNTIMRLAAQEVGRLLGRQAFVYLDPAGQAPPPAPAGGRAAEAQKGEN